MNARTLTALTALKPTTAVCAILMRFVEYGKYDKLGRLIAMPVMNTVGFMCRKDVERYKRFNRGVNGSELFSETTRNVAMKPCVASVFCTSKKLRDKAATGSGHFAYVDGVLFVRLTRADGKKLSVAVEATHIATVNGVMTLAASPNRYVITPL